MSKKNRNVSDETIENQNVDVNENESNENQSNDFKEKIQNTSIDRVKVVAKYNNGSFDKGCEYEISKKVLENYNGLFDIL
mgnify:CR=1 FL=1